MRSLPPELTIKIMGYLKEDKKTLLACCLVTSSWVGPSRFYLFSQLTLRAPEDMNWQPLISSLKNTPAIIPYVRHLTIQSRDLNGNRWEPICEHELSSMLEVLPALKCLDLTHLCFRCRHDTVNALSIHTPPRVVDTAQISDCRTERTDSILPCVLALFSEVRRLRIHGLMGPFTEHFVPKRAMQKRTRVQELEITEASPPTYGAEDLFQLLVTCPDTVILSLCSLRLLAQFNDCLVATSGCLLQRLILKTPENVLGK